MRLTNLARSEGFSREVGLEGLAEALYQVLMLNSRVRTLSCMVASLQMLGWESVGS